MLGVDTNVLVRFFTRDEPAQFEAARKLIAQAPEGGLFVEPVVLVELNWVLRRVYRLPREEVFVVLDGLMDFREFTIGQRPLVLKALATSAATGCDFSDALIGLLHEAAGSERTVTFDEKAQKLPQMAPVEAMLK